MRLDQNYAGVCDEIRNEKKRHFDHTDGHFTNYLFNDAAIG